MTLPRRLGAALASRLRATGRRTGRTHPHPHPLPGAPHPYGASRGPRPAPVAPHLPRAAARPHVLIETGSPVRPYVLVEGAAR